MIAAHADRSYTGDDLRPAHVDGKPMPAYAVNHAEWQQKTADEIRRYRVVNKLNIKKACQLAGVTTRWYHYHRDLIERPRPKPAA